MLPAARLRKPHWLRVPLPTGEEYFRIRQLLSSLNLATVCQSANCPNMAECWGGGTATIMLMGDICTRGCRFCNVKTGNPKGWLDPEEPQKVTRAISQMGLNYVVLTSVDRDDLPDEGAGHFAKTIQQLRDKAPQLLIEVLTPDFKGRIECLQKIITAHPDVFAHNIETVKRLTPRVRDPRAGYQQSLNVLQFVKQQNPKMYTKSSLMLGLGEKDAEVRETLKELRAVGCDVVTFGQYLQPQKRHLPVKEYLPPKKFEYWKKTALQMGFLYAAGGPLVRSSYRAGELFMQALIQKQRNSKSYTSEQHKNGNN